MVKLKIFCVTNKMVPALENSNYILGGVGKSNFNNYYLRSDHGINIFFIKFVVTHPTQNKIRIF